MASAITPNAITLEIGLAIFDSFVWTYVNRELPNEEPIGAFDRLQVEYLLGRAQFIDRYFADNPEARTQAMRSFWESASEMGLVDPTDPNSWI